MYNTKFAVAMATILLTLMLITSVQLMRKSLRGKVNVAEFICMRIGFSLYAGWVTSAATLQWIYCMNDLFVPVPDDANKSFVASIIIWVLLPIYAFGSFYERNPIYGLVYIWTVGWIYNHHKNNE